MSFDIADDPTRDWKTERLNEMAFAFKNAAALTGAIELGLFTAIAEGAGTAAEVAEKIGVEREAAERLLIVCHALDLIGVVDGRYKCFSDVERYLVRSSPTYFGDYLVYTVKQDAPLWQDVAKSMRPGAGGPPAEKYYPALMADEVGARAFTEAGYNASIALAHRLAKRFDFSRFGRWLDLGGGSGCYSIAACERHPRLKTVIMDFPNVLAVTREFVAKHGLEDRIETVPGEFFGSDYPAGCDLVSFITPLQGYMPDEVIFLLKKAYEAVAPGGAILVVDYMLTDDKSGPLDPALFNLQGVVDGQYMGRVNSGPEFTDFLHQAGFRDVEIDWLMPHQLGQITAWKR